MLLDLQIAASPYSSFHCVSCSLSSLKVQSLIEPFLTLQFAFSATQKKHHRVDKISLETTLTLNTRIMLCLTQPIITWGQGNSCKICFTRRQKSGWKLVCFTKIKQHFFFFLHYDLGLSCCHCNWLSTKMNLKSLIRVHHLAPSLCAKITWMCYAWPYFLAFNTNCFQYWLNSYLGLFSVFINQ